MKTLYIECNMGAAGDMLMAGLLGLHDDPADFLARLNRITPDGVSVLAEPSVKCGIAGTHIQVTVNGEHEHHDHDHGDHNSHKHEHSHNNYHSIGHVIEHLNITETVKTNAMAVYRTIAEAESHVHGVPVEQIHFHEVGELDAVTDIVGVCMLIEELGAQMIYASPVNVGSGSIRAAHGVLPVPAPATAHILHGVPFYSDNTRGELCTPTGAALLKHFVREYGDMPALIVDKTGYGMGSRDFEKANCVRIFSGQLINSAAHTETVTELKCNIDDMTPEALGFAADILLGSAALDVCVTPAVMKKGRAGFVLSCVCRPADKAELVGLIFRHTSTLGIREYTCPRYTLEREETQIMTPYGAVRAKRSYGYGAEKLKPEYEDVAQKARENGVPLGDILK